MAKLAVQVEPSHMVEMDTFMTSRYYQDHVAGFMEFMAIRMTRRLDFVMRNRTFRRRWKPLSKTWKAFKKEMKLDPKQWIASGQLKDSIQYWHSRSAKSWFVGVHPRKQHNVYKKGGIYSTKKTKVLLVDIVRRLEYGTRKIPPRPLFGPIMAEFQRDLGKHYGDYIQGKKP